MTWVKIDDRLPEHPKVIGLSDKAFRLYVTSICFASTNKTDGEIPPAAISRMGGTPKLAAELVAAVLWDSTSRGGWVVHDYLKYNRAKEAIDELSDKRSKAGSKGLANRWQNANQIASVLPLSGSGSSNTDLQQPLGNDPGEEEAERQKPSKLPDDVYRQIDTAWIQSAGTTLPRVAGERFEAYALKASVDWVLDAISETGHANVKDPRYAYKILDNWLRDGREQAPKEAANRFKESRVLQQAAAWKERNG